MSGTLAPLPVSQTETVFHGQAMSSVWFGGEAKSMPEQPLENNTFETSGHKPRALIVDDAPDVVEMLAIFLKQSGYEVATASSAPDALSAAQTGAFDIIVSDIGMPGMNGYELVKALRELPDYEAVPMIALTGFSMYDDRERALNAGFNAYLTKPIDPASLVELMERLRDSRKE